MNRGFGRPGPRGRRVNKPTDFKAAIVKLIRFAKPFYPFIVVAILIAVASSVLAVIAPNLLGNLVDVINDGIKTSIDMKEIWKLAIPILIIFGLSAIFLAIQSLIMTWVVQNSSKKLRSNLLAKVNKLPFNYFDKTQTGDILSRMTNDVDLMSQSLQDGLASLISQGVLMIGALLMMFITSWQMSLGAVVAVLIGFVIMMIIMKRSQKYHAMRQKSLGKINGHIEEVYSGLQVIKVYNASKKSKEEFETYNQEIYDSNWRSAFYGRMMPNIMNFIGNLSYVVVSVLGAILVYNGIIKFGVIISFMVYVRLFSNPLSRIAQSFGSLQSAAAASERVFELLEQEELDDEEEITLYLSPENVKGFIEFENVSFGYTPEVEVIHNLNAIAKPGQKVAIVGPTGAGKTTIVSLLMRFYELNSGAIKIDNIKTTDLKRSNVRELFDMVLQDSWIIEGTVKENIIYAREGISDEQVINAAKTANIDHFIRTLPKGYDTLLDEKTTFSSGQLQLLTIARAMIDPAPFLILDEATSNVDTRTEILIQEAMDLLMKGKTSFIIAHRLSTIKNADLILVLRDGDIVEQGTHDELIEQKGFYEMLYTSQFEF